MEEAERMERRERDKRERAKMSLTQNPEPEPEMPYFPEPFRVSLNINTIEIICILQIKFPYSYIIYII